MSAAEPFLRLGVSTRGGIMAVMAVDADAPVAVKERLEAFAGEVLAAAMNPAGAAGQRRVVSAGPVGGGCSQVA